jgi:hypothetical protein
MPTILTTAVLPLLSVLLGGALTYWLNARARRRTFIEDHPVYFRPQRGQP